MVEEFASISKIAISKVPQISSLGLLRHFLINVTFTPKAVAPLPLHLLSPMSIMATCSKTVLSRVHEGILPHLSGLGVLMSLWLLLTVKCLIRLNRKVGTIVAILIMKLLPVM